MRRLNILKSLIILIIFSTMTTSCGLIEKFQSSEEPTDSNMSDASENTSTETVASSESDDLFKESMSESNEEAKTVASDTTSEIKSENLFVDDELKTLEDEFTANPENAPAQTEIAKSDIVEPELKQVKVEESAPVIQAESSPMISENQNNDAGKTMNYSVQKGETLMQIAFKLYGDTSKWKSLKQMNDDKLASKSALTTNMQLKYVAPEKTFVWNPEGTPYLIKNGETLGTISNSVYQTPKKWKKIWENNKPLIKNPNVIYAGFTVYYTGSEMANYVQPKANQKTRQVATQTTSESEDQKFVEEVKVDQALSKLEQSDSNEIDLTKQVQSSTSRSMNEEVRADEASDEALGN